jgi:hypothetical protein
MVSDQLLRNLNTVRREIMLSSDQKRNLCSMFMQMMRVYSNG